MQTSIKKRVVGVDIGNRLTSYAIVDVRGNVIAHDSFATPDYPEINHYVDKLTESIITIIEANGGYETIRSVGISCPSASYASGCIENAANLPWKGVVPLGAMLRDRLGMAVALGNDAHNTALGEKMFGSAHGMKNFIVLNLGVGLGSCFFSEGHEHQGADGYAGEIGHTCIEDHGRPCPCGLEGCLEAYVAAAGIVQTARELMEASDEPTKMRDIKELDPPAIVQLCEEGDAMAIEVFRRTGYLFGRGLATYASIVNPEAIIVTGGISSLNSTIVSATCSVPAPWLGKCRNTLCSSNFLNDVIMPRKPTSPHFPMPSGMRQRARVSQLRRCCLALWTVASPAPVTCRTPSFSSTWFHPPSSPRQDSMAWMPSGSLYLEDQKNEDDRSLPIDIATVLQMTEEGSDLGLMDGLSPDIEKSDVYDRTLHPCRLDFERGLEYRIVKEFFKEGKKVPQSVYCYFSFE